MTLTELLTRRPQVALPQKKYDFKVFLSMCVHRHIDPDSCMNLVQLLMCPNPKFIWSRRRGDALIDRARSLEASIFLTQADFDVLMFLDDDIVYDPLDAVKLCRLVHDNKDVDIAGGAYVLKQDKNNHFTTKLFKGQKVVFGNGAEPVEVRAVATGFMAVHKRVFEKLSKIIPLCHKNTLKFYPFFQPYPKEIDGNWIYLSEDWAFTERAREQGFKVWCDPSIKLGHAGRKIYDWDCFFTEQKEKKTEFEYTEAYREK